MLATRMRQSAAGNGGVTYLARDEFITNRTAGNVTGTAMEPGPGTRTLSDTIPTYPITGGELVGAAASVGARDPWLRDATQRARLQGRMFAAKVRFISVSGGTNAQHSVGWVSTLTNPAATNYDGFEVYTGATIIRQQGGGGPTMLGSGFTFGVNYVLAIVMLSTGALYIVDGNLYYVSKSNSNASYASIQAATSARTALGIDNWTEADLGSPFTGSTDICTNAIATPTDGQTTTGEQDAFTEFTWTPASAETMTLMIRRTDDDNTVKLVCSQSGGTIKLYRREAGVDTEINAGKTQTWSVGTAYRVCVVYSGQAVRTYVNNVDKHSGNINYNTTVTGIKVGGFATGANLQTRPVVLSGAALAELQRFLV